MPRRVNAGPIRRRAALTTCSPTPTAASIAARRTGGGNRARAAAGRRTGRPATGGWSASIRRDSAAQPAPPAVLAEAEGAAGRVMLDPIRRLLAEAGKAKQTRAFWQAATDILSEWAGGARVHLSYKGLNESGSIEAGTPGKDGETFLTDYHDAEGRHVSARFEGLPAGTPGDATCAGRVIQTGEPLLADNILKEAGARSDLSPSGTARAAMIAPLRTSSGVAGAVGVVRYVRPGSEEPPPFTLLELQ